jgi:hypothetical protein
MWQEFSKLRSNGTNHFLLLYSLFIRVLPQFILMSITFLRRFIPT